MGKRKMARRHAIRCRRESYHDSVLSAMASRDEVQVANLIAGMAAVRIHDQLQSHPTDRPVHEIRKSVANAIDDAIEELMHLNTTMGFDSRWQEIDGQG